MYCDERKAKDGSRLSVRLPVRERGKRGRRRRGGSGDGDGTGGNANSHSVVRPRRRSLLSSSIEGDESSVLVQWA